MLPSLAVVQGRFFALFGVYLVWWIGDLALWLVGGLGFLGMVVAMSVQMVRRKVGQRLALFAIVLELAVTIFSIEVLKQI